MVYCKLCGDELSEEKAAKADKNLCKKCYSNLAKYRRWQTRRVDTPLLQHQETVVKSLEALFESNIKAGRFVPQCYKAAKHKRRCITCDEVFITGTGLKLCKTCDDKEHSYIALVNNEGKRLKGQNYAVYKEGDLVEYNRKRLALGRYETEYEALHKQGKHVPPLFLRRWGYDNNQA